MPNILFSFAHPDDESFSGAGTAMQYASAGATIVLVTATRGERGKVGDPPVCSPEELPSCREQELREASRIIGFHELQILDHEDQKLAGAPPEDMRRALIPVIRRHRPDVVITFDANGFNVHPDHVAISRFTSDAIAASADPRWHPEYGPPHVVRRLLWTPPFPPWEASKFERLEDHAGADFVIDVAHWRERRIAALRAHRTQHLSIDRCFFSQPDLDRVLAVETWRQAWGPPLARRPSADIFEGL